MGDFFGSMYCIFEDFFGLDLANYLWGEASPNVTNNLYIGIGLTMIGLSFFIPLLYYIIIDHPKLSKWWGWLIFMGINALLNLILGWQWCLTDLYSDKMKDASGVDLNISITDCWCFGFSNMFLSIFFFIILMFLVKWKSVNCSHSPF